MTTRPGFVWDATASEWVEIGQAAVLAPVKYQATAPSSPATGDIWIESDVDVPSVDSAQFLRWRKTMTGGETSLSGNDDSSLPLRYTPGYEQLFINGVLQVRGGDYTATTGTTVTGLTALVANDVVEIFSAVARSVADVYTQTQSDARFASQTNFPAGVWTSYTPTLTAFTTNPTLGSGGGVSGRYIKLGKTVIGQASIIFGSSGVNAGAGTYYISLPINRPTNNEFALGSAVMRDASSSYIGQNGTVQGTGAGADKAVIVYGGSAFSASATGPWTWAASDQIFINFTYEVA
jgi:hypothetical protein